MYTASIRSNSFVIEPTASLGKKVGHFLASHTPSLSILCLRVAAIAISIFGKWGQQAAEFFRREANKIHFIYITHDQYRVKSAPLSILVASVNMPRRDVVFKEEDIAAANHYRTLLLSDQFQARLSSCSLDIHFYEKLRSVQFRGARTQGICQSATLVFIKTVLERQPTSEEALKEVAAMFEEGFPKEAAGLYEIYDTLELASRKHTKDESNGEFAKIEKLIEKSDTQNELVALLERAKNLQQEAMKRLLELKEKTFQIYCALLGIPPREKLEKSFACYISNFLAKKEMQERFDCLQNGVYYLGFSTGESGHAIAMLKYDFGTYFFDPNKGLMKCDKSKPSLDFVKLYQTYPKADCALLVVIPTP